MSHGSRSGAVELRLAEGRGTHRAGSTRHSLEARCCGERSCTLSLIAYTCSGHFPAAHVSVQVSCQYLFRLTAAEMSQYIGALLQEWLRGRVDIQNAKLRNLSSHYSLVI